MRMVQVYIIKDSYQSFFVSKWKELSEQVSRDNEVPKIKFYKPYGQSKLNILDYSFELEDKRGLVIPMFFPRLHLLRRSSEDFR